MEENMADDSEDDDPVVHEVDVFLAKSLAERLYLFQYPVRPSCLSYDEIPHVAARMKPKQQKVELELALDTDSGTYCLPRGEQIAYAVDEAATENSRLKGPYYQGGCMDKQVLTSVRSSEEPSKYVAGVFKQGALHLTPIHGFVQLRPSFEYLDRADDNKQTTSSARIDEANEDEEEAKPVLTRFARQETDKMAQKKKQSFFSIEQKLAEEPWIDMNYVKSSSSNAASMKMLLQCHQQEFESPEFTATSREYLETLAPALEGVESHPAALPHGVLSMASLKKMELADQIKALLINAKVIQFHHLLALLGPGIDEKAILKGLYSYAVLVQGCWVVKSEVMYPKGSKCSISGIEAETIWPARDYVMWRFNHRRLLERKDIMSTIRIPSEELRDMLEQVARQKLPQGWEFMLPTDVDFLHKHHDVVKSQLEVWKLKANCFKQSLNIPKDNLNKQDDVLPGLDASLYTKGRVGKPRTKSRDSTEKVKRSNSGAEDEKSPRKSNSVAAAAAGAVNKNEIKLLEKSDSGQKNDNSLMDTENVNGIIKNEPTEETRKIKPEPTEQDSNIHHTLAGMEMIVDSDHELGFTNDVTSEHMPDLNGDLFPNAFVPPVASGKAPLSMLKPPSDIFLQELDKFITETLKGGCLSLAEVKGILTLRQQESGNILCSGVSDELLEKQILKVGASRLIVKWPENVTISPEQKNLYAFRTTGDQRDHYRQAVLDMFSESFCMKKAEVCGKLQEKFSSTLSNHLFPRFMSEFCEKYGSAWYLRGTYKAAYPKR